MPSPFEIPTARVATLNEDVLVALVNRLIWAEACRVHAAPGDIQISLRINDPDGGADALTRVGETNSRYLGAGQRIWQFKRRWPNEDTIRRELQKPAVQEGFRSGAVYTLVVGQASVPWAQKKHKEALQALAQTAGCQGVVEVLHGDQLAAWASAVPAATFELQPLVQSFWRADGVLRSPRHAHPFEADEMRDQVMAAVEAALFSAGARSVVARILGKPGVGKTRLALELVRRLGLDTVAVYSPDPVGREIFAWVQANDEVDMVLIVDECPDGVADELEQWAQLCAGRLRLVTIGTEDMTGSDIYRLGPLDADSMRRVVAAAAPTLDDERVRWVADKTGGYVKLAVAVAQAITRDDVTVEELRKERTVAQAVTRMIATPGSDRRKTLQGMSLLTRVGWERELAHEGRAVAAFVGLDWTTMQMVGSGLQDEGLVSAQGRYRYVSPELLAQWLASEVWFPQVHRVTELLDSLPTPAARDACLLRLAQVGSVPSVRSIIENEVFSGEGPFQSLDQLDDEVASRRFQVLAEAAPAAALRRLQEVVGSASIERLRLFERGRRSTLWTLEFLAERRELFFEAARLVRRLAEAENETFSNNATGVWQSFFLTHLAGTEVPAPERLLLIGEALEAASGSVQRLGISGLAAALEASEFGLALRQHADVPPSTWRPATRDDALAYKARALAMLAPLLDRATSDEREAALDAFLSNARALAEHGLGWAVVERFSRLQPESETERRRIWESAMDVRRYGRRLPEDLVRMLDRETKRFYGDSLADRIKRYTGTWSHVDWPDDGEPDARRQDEVAASLAEDAIGRLDEVRPILPWLFSGEAELASVFGHRLGQVDSTGEWLEELAAHALGGNDARLLSAYLNGRADSGESAWREDLLDSWADDRARAAVVFDATFRGPPSDRAAERAFGLVGKGWLDPSALRYLQFGGWPGSISPDSVARLLRLMGSNTPATAAATLAVLFGALAAPRGRRSRELVSLAWAALEDPRTSSAASMQAFHWRRVAEHLLPSNPPRVAKIVLGIAAHQGMYKDQRLELLKSALQIAPEKVWGVVGAALLRRDSLAQLTLHWSLLGSGVVEAVSPDVVLDWIQSRGKRAAQAVAHVVKPSGERLSELARGLLRTHRDSVDGILATNVVAGTWIGSQADYLDKLRLLAEGWMFDEEPDVRLWANGLARWLAKQIAQERLREEENR